MAAMPMRKRSVWSAATPISVKPTPAGDFPASDLPLIPEELKRFAFCRPNV
jgi:hypothetical protein